MNIKLIFSGEGGQGIQTIAKILSESAIKNGTEVTYMPSFGVEQRGTPSVAYVTISNKKLRYPKFEIADYVIVLAPRAIDSVNKFISPNTKVIFDSSTISEKDLPKTAINLSGFPASREALEKFSPRSFNLIILGLISKQLKIPEKIVWEAIMDNLGKKFKTDEIKASNHDAFMYGRSAIFEKNDFSKAVFKPKHRSIIFKGHGKTCEISPSRCKGCGICIEKCPVAALSFSDELGVYATPIPKIDLEKCISCGNCKNFCPDGAISVEKN